jgi:hypothetical protein
MQLYRSISVMPPSASSLKSTLRLPLQVIIQRLGEEHALRSAVDAAAPRVLELLGRLLATAAAAQPPASHDEALLALGALICFQGDAFAPTLQVGACGRAAGHFLDVPTGCPSHHRGGGRPMPLKQSVEPPGSSLACSKGSDVPA